MHGRFEIKQFNQRTNGPVVHRSPLIPSIWGGGGGGEGGGARVSEFFLLRIQIQNKKNLWGREMGGG